MSKRGHPEIPYLIDGGGQSVAYTGTAGTISNAVGAQTRKVLVWCSTAAHVVTGAAPTATTGDPAIPANTPMYFRISGGHKVSAVQVTTGGTLFVGEVTD